MSAIKALITSLPIKVANSKLDAAVFFAHAATGSAPAGRRSWVRSDLGKHMREFTHRAQALGASTIVVGTSFALSLKEAAELANVTNPLLPITLDFAATAFVAQEVDNLLGFEVAIPVRLLGSIIASVVIGSNKTASVTLCAARAIRVDAINTISPTVPAIVGS